MKCIITGGAGFIGSHLADRLLDEGHSLILIDNLITGNIRNISHLLIKDQVQFVNHDCSLPLPSEIEADIIFHFASPASPPKYQDYAIETLLVNTRGTYHLLELAKRIQARFVYASTSEVYGDPLEHPQTESYWGNVNPVGPRACYDEAKRAGEAFVMTYFRKFQLDVRMVRIFNTYGPRMDINDGRVVTNFIEQILNGKSITIYGNGNQTRSFCYITDLVDAIDLVGFSHKASGEIFNIGNPDDYTVSDLAKILMNMAHYTGKIKHENLPVDDPKRRKPDISKMKKWFGWEPKVKIQDGLKRTLDYFQVPS